MANIKGTNNKDILNGTAGADKIYGYGGDDIIYGKDGDDEIYGGAGNDELYGGAGDDIIGGGDGNDVIYGGIGSDTLYGAAGDDVIKGGDGNDVIFGGTGNDTLYGGAGDDVIKGGDGNDVIYAGSGSDTIYGDAGDDKIYAGEGADIIYGGEGIDTVSYENYVAPDGGRGRGVEVHLNNSGLGYGYGHGHGISAGDKYYDIENVIGTQYNDTIYGDSGDNIIWGNGGNDTLCGFSQNMYNQTKEISYLIAGNDTFYTGSRTGDNIRINLGYGNNIVYGGAGDETVVISVPTQTSLTALGILIGSNKFYLGEGDNTVSMSTGNEVEITAGDGENTIWLYADQYILEDSSDYSTTSTSIALGNGDNHISLRDTKGNTDITTKNGDDNIHISCGIASAGGSLNIDAGEGNNYIFATCLYGWDIDIASGNGNDQIKLSWGKFESDFTPVTAKINAGDGDNAITIGDHGHNAFNVITGHGNDHVSMNNTNYDLLAISEENRKERIIDTGAGDDTFYIHGNIMHVSFYAGAGNDYVSTYFTSYLNIDAGTGNDLINVGPVQNSYFEGGTGNDIYALYHLDESTGNVINNYDNDNSYDTLKLKHAYSDEYYSAILDGDDLVINFHLTDNGANIVNTLTLQNYALGSDYEFNEIHIGNSIYSSDQFLAEMGLTL